MNLAGRCRELAVGCGAGKKPSNREGCYHRKMKYAFTLFACATLALLVACGGSNNNIQSVQVSPAQGEGSGPNSAVNFTATGTFPNNQSRLLTSQDGLMWSSSNSAVATINPLTGQAVCVTPGSVTITAAVPSDLTFQGGPHSSSRTVNGTASLQCTNGT